MVVGQIFLGFLEHLIGYLFKSHPSFFGHYIFDFQTDVSQSSSLPSKFLLIVLYLFLLVGTAGRLVGEERNTFVEVILVFGRERVDLRIVMAFHIVCDGFPFDFGF